MRNLKHRGNSSGVSSPLLETQRGSGGKAGSRSLALVLSTLPHSLGHWGRDSCVDRGASLVSLLWRTAGQVTLQEGCREGQLRCNSADGICFTFSCSLCTPPQEWSIACKLLLKSACLKFWGLSRVVIHISFWVFMKLFVGDTYLQ